MTMLVMKRSPLSTTTAEAVVVVAAAEVPCIQQQEEMVPLQLLPTKATAEISEHHSQTTGSSKSVVSRYWT